MLTACLLTWVAQTASGQLIHVSGFELEQLQLNPAGRGGLVVGGGDVLPSGTGRIGAAAHYEYGALAFYERPLGQTRYLRRGYLVEHRWTTHLSAAYAFTRWLEAGLQVPVVVAQSGSDLSSSLGIAPVPRRASLGTPHVQFRFGFLREFDNHPVDVSLGLMVGLPFLGSKDGLTKDPSVPLQVRLGLGKTWAQQIRLGLEVGAWIRPVAVSLLETLPNAIGNRVSSQFTAGAVLSTVGEGFRAEVSARSAIPFDGSPWGMEILGGLRLPIGKWELFALAGPGFGRNPGTPTARALLGAAYGGGWAASACRNPSAPVDECPDNDLDGDGISNRLDRCPSEKGPAMRDGCPLLDFDDDGVEDSVDNCPKEKGLRALSGCPAIDSDGDGLYDSEDRCPDKKGPSALGGCPPKNPDLDQDGVPNEFDNCPEQPGPASNQGCPAQNKQSVSIGRGQLLIRERIQFAPGKAKLLPASNSILSQISDILKSHPEIKGLLIQGHTDSQGRRADNLQLSRARAEAVRLHLIGQGVAPQRLKSEGWGPDRPRASNQTPRGREQNRRVEFHLEAESTEQRSR